MTIVNVYINKEIHSYTLDSKTPKLEIKQKLVIIVDGERTVFACKLCDFISFAITPDKYTEIDKLVMGLDK